MKLQTKLSILLLVLGVIILAAGGVLSSIEVENYFRERIVHELKTHAREMEYSLRFFVNATPGDEIPYEKIQEFSHTAGIRLTLIAANGKVLFDSEIPKKQINDVENHLYRPEVQNALMTGEGISQRHSATVNADMLYAATKLSEPLQSKGILSDVAVLRVSILLTEVQQAVNELRLKVLIAGTGALLLVIVMTVIVSKQFTRPITKMAKAAEQIRAGNLEQRIAVRSKDELGKLAETLNSMIDRLNEDIVRLKRLERVRSEFLGNVSHELRTPLFALQSAIETLLNGAIDDPSVNKEFLQKALHHSQRLDELLSDLIEISRIESGEMKMSFRYFDLKDFLQSVVSEMQQDATKKGVSLTYEQLAQPINVLGDKERLKQAMSNLLSNAIKFSDGGGTVTVSEESSNGSVRISVRDTGCGIPAEHLPRIFERFYRVDKDRSREVGGTGLGLAIVKHIVEAHGSNVDVQSEVGKGSVFSFKLKK